MWGRSKWFDPHNFDVFTKTRFNLRLLSSCFHETLLMRIRNDVKLSWKIEKCLKWRKEFLCQHWHYSLNICHWSYVPCQRRNIDSCSNFVFRNVTSFTLLVKTSHEMGISRKITRPAACTYESLKIPLEFKTR